MNYPYQIWVETTSADQVIMELMKQRNLQILISAHAQAKKR